METEALVKLFEPYADSIAEGGDNLIEGFNDIVCVMLTLKPFEMNVIINTEER